MFTQITQKNSFKYVCEKCDFHSNKKNDYKRHLQTKKHNVDKCLHNDDTKNSFSCTCGKTFAYRQSLSRHKKTCTYKHEEKSDTQPVPTEIPDTPTLTSLLMKLIDTNEDLKNEIIELASKPRTINNNKTFNLNNFLNVECKDAMNLSEFIESIKLTFQDLLYVGEHGFVQSFRNSFIKSLQTLEKTKRPIHCTDRKRKTLKVKDNDMWETDKDGKKVKKTVDDFSRKQLLAYKKHYQDRDPDFLDDETNLDNNNKMILGMCEYSNDSAEHIKNLLLKDISNITTIKL